MTGNATSNRVLIPRCKICKQRMVPYNAMPAWLWNLLPLTDRFRGRLDCGGDCCTCMFRIEGVSDE